MRLHKDIYLDAYQRMYRVRKLSELIDKHAEAQQFVHSFPTGHEAVQTAAGMLLEKHDHAFPYYRDTSLIHACGFDLKDQLKQLFSTADEGFSGGTSYFNHICYKGDQHPNILLQSAATGMQAIPAVGLAQGLQYLQDQDLAPKREQIVLCSMGEGALSSGEVSEAIQMAVFLQLPIVFLIQDNGWIISAEKKETVSSVTLDFYRSVAGLDFVAFDGWDLETCFSTLEKTYNDCRKRSQPVVVHATIKLLGHHTSKVKKNTYRVSEQIDEDLAAFDPVKIAHDQLEQHFKEIELDELHAEMDEQIHTMVEEVEASNREIDKLPPMYAPVDEAMERGERQPDGAVEVCMAEAASKAIEEIMETYPEAVYQGQDIGAKLGGVFRESYGLANKFGPRRVLNMSIQEAYMIGSLSGLSAAGCKPITFIQFADYFMLGINQLFTEISKSYFLTAGKWPVQCLIRMPVGNYRGAGPYHGASIESILLNIPGVKIIYPSNAADLKGLLRAGFDDVNPVICMEHKGLYWAANPNTSSSRSLLPEPHYSIPLGKANMVLEASTDQQDAGRALLVITYGLGVHLAMEAARSFDANISVLDLRSLEPLDYEKVREQVKVHSKCMVVSEEAPTASFAASLAARIQEDLFQYLDAPVAVVGNKAVPGIPINPSLEKLVLISSEKIREKMETLLNG